MHRILKGADWKVLKRHVLPKNTAVHQENRVKFCQQFIGNTFGGDGDSIFWVDVDEKNFYSFHHRIVYVPAELMEKFNYVHTESKTNIESVMFFGAVARP